jgi:hypothetical protein
MARIIPLAHHLSPDTVFRLKRAAKLRFKEADHLLAKKHRLAAVYFYGHCVEMCLSAAYFRSVGFSGNVPIDRDTRRRRMAQARQLRIASGEPLMNNDPHPLVGWARFLQWQRNLPPAITTQESQRLKEAVNRAEKVYRHWRPELRYKTIDVRPDQSDEVRRAAAWFIENQERL